ncbi:hypothetical protein RRF57_011771 [Xylaria bambusicola]|uniref:Uncharacterized protein n=1 Tax=Xylaria bambusicola TaxID=326684 RepID=A0AAN7V338_9PEZI
MACWSMVISDSVRICSALSMSFILFPRPAPTSRTSANARATAMLRLRYPSALTAERMRVMVRILDISLIPSPSFPRSQPRIPRSSSSAVGSDFVPILFLSRDIVTPLSSVPPTTPVAETRRDGLCRLIGA